MHSTPVRIGLSALAGMLVMFAWGFVWFAVSPFATTAIQPLPPALEQVVREQSSVGAFYAPGKKTEAGVTGPVMVLHSAGFITSLPKNAPIGMTHYFVCALMLSIAAVALKSTLNSYGRRVMFFAGAGTFVALAGSVFLPVWYDAPWGFFGFLATNDILGWSLAGLAMAAILKPQPTL